MVRLSPCPARHPSHSRLEGPLAAVLALLLTTAACGGPSDVSQPVESYSVRGLVRHLPEPGRQGQELLVWHEAILDFKNAEGKIVGMESMSMGFPLADAELTADLAVGDRIRMDFEVRWDGGHPLTITAIEKLPPETRLAFEAREADSTDTDTEEAGSQDDSQEGSTASDP